MSKTITIYEFGLNESFISLKDSFCSETKTISELDYKRIFEFEKKQGISVLKFSEQKKLIAQQYVGVLKIGDNSIEILPKIEGLDTEDTIRKNLISMLAVTKKLDIKDSELAKLGVQNLNLLEILIRLFCDRFFEQMKKGFIHNYEYRQENLNYIKGKILPNLNIRKNYLSSEKTFCEYDEFHIDTPLNRTFKTTIQFLLKNTKDNKNRVKLRELAFALDDVSNIAPEEIEWNRIHFDRQTKRYEILFNLARLFLNKKTNNVSSGDTLGFALVFDMNELFEEYIGIQASSIAGKQSDFNKFFKSVKLQSPMKPLLLDQSNNKGMFVTKPDITITNFVDENIIIDTKWKIIDPEKNKSNISQQDIYQMLAYSINYSSKDVFLLYPYQSNLSQNGLYKTYKVNSAESKTNIHIASIALNDLSLVRQQLNEILSVSREFI